MKKRLYCLLILILSMMAAAFAYASQDAPEEFRGVKWGANVKELADMSSLPNSNGPDSNGDERSYTKKDEPLKMEAANIEAVRYDFYQGSFYKGVVEFKSRANFELIKKQLEGRFGSPSKSLGQSLVWDWPKKINIELYFSLKKDYGKVTYLYRPLLEKKLVDQKIKEKRKRRAHYTE